MPAAWQSHLVLGGARSGKSRHAVALAERSGGPTAFLATAIPGDADMRARIARHRAERPAWHTVEEPLELVAACRGLVPVYPLVVVDCLTVWVSNLLARGEEDDAVLARAEELAKLLGERLADLILISNEVGLGVHPPTALGLRFRDLLGQVNQRVAAAADRVTLMVAGIPVSLKDVPPEIPRERPPEAP